MTRVLLVTYTLRNKFKSYDPLFEAIKANSTRWFHYIDSAWVVETILTADQFAHKLYPFIEQPDYLLVVRIINDHQGWLPKEAWDWLNSIHY
jgi:hypothetical protein